ncbi:RNA-directed DNA polymerase from transposon X-element, partial [Paramuricea clavata]
IGTGNACSFTDKADIYDWAAFKKARNSVNNEIKFAKKAHYMNAFHENEIKYLNCHISGNTFELKSTTSSMVCSLLDKLCKSKATGLDKISAKLLRYCPDLLSESLTVIFNCSINTGIFPDEWKCSKVIPLFKHGERRDLNNYRPISIIPVVAKVFERIIYDQIYAFLTDNNLLCNSQSGFRCLHSTVTALLESTNNWAYNIDQGRVNAVVFLDLKKAFDTVNHGILLSKLNAYGLGGAVGNWFKSYLSDRSQKCYVNGHLSNNRPLLFLLYINDLPNCLEHSQARMYADDTNLTFASNNIDDINYHLNHDLANVNKWLIANKLTLNQSKTEFMLIGSRQRIATFRSVPCLEIDGVPIDKVLQAKSLGVYLDENLSWNIQINELTKKIASGIGALKRVRSFVPVATLQLIFNSLVQPYFNYCCTVWDNCNKTLAEKLQKLQNRAARVLTFSSYDTNADGLIEKLGWKKLASQRQFQKAVMVYKSLNGLAPDYMHSMFVNRDSVNPYSLRNTENKLAVPKPRTNYLKNSFSYSGAVLWNSLPIGLRQANNLINFRSGLHGPHEKQFVAFPCLEIDGVPIDKVLQAKSLGVYLDENLSWNIQINELTKKIASGIGALKRVRSFVPVATLQLIFNSLVQPYFNYCCTVWDNCNKTLAEKLQKLQNRAARVLTFSSYDTNADGLIEKLGWKKLSSQRQFQKAVMVYKSLNGLAPDYMHSILVHGPHEKQTHDNHDSSLQEWKFDELDTDNNDVLVNRELEAFNGLFEMEPCLYGLLRRCAQHNGTGITRPEWSRCLSDSRSTRELTSDYDLLRQFGYL